MKHNTRFHEDIQDFRSLWKEIALPPGGKKALWHQPNHLSILFPIFFLCRIFLVPTTVYIEQLHLTLWGQLTPYPLLILTVLWVSVSPLKKYCCDGTILETCYNSLPPLIYFFLVFAQWHFYIAVCLFFLLFISYIVAARVINLDYPNTDSDQDWHRRKKKKVRFCVAMTAAVLLLPGFTAYVLYEMQSPYTYTSEQELSSVVSPSEDVSIYDQNLDALQAFQEDNWDTLSTQERVDLLQWLANFEAEKLGFDPVSLTAERINLYTLGDYDSDTNTIRIDVKQVAQSSAADCMEVICHEVWHAYEYYIVDQLDWSSPIVQTAYFDEIRTWKYNIENYQSGWYSYEAYIEQGLEDSAFSYAEEEVAEILSYAEGDQG